jgi:adenosylcobinamide-phosphate synthase
MNGALALISAVLLDLTLGEPPNRVHPVAWMGRAIEIGRDWALNTSSKFGQLTRGAAIALLLPSGVALMAYGATRLLSSENYLATFMTALLLKPLFAIRALRDAAFLVRDALRRGDLASARSRLRSLCSRDATDLPAPELIAATVESIAENASDSIVAPLLYFAIGRLPAAAFYRMTNTLDAMIGYRGRFEWVGKVAARLDDALNFVPARVTAWMFVIAAPLAGADAIGGARMLVRDGKQTQSPNAGLPMAAMAGLLGVRLEKAQHYALGEPRRSLDVEDITRAWRIVALAAYAATALAAALLWAIARRRV